MARWLFVPERRNAPELMDQPGLPEAEVADAYRVLRRVNRQLGNRFCLVREFQRALREDFEGTPPNALSLLDVGSGSGDLPHTVSEQIAQRGLVATCLALDRDPTAVRLARQPGLDAIRGDALRLPLADRSIDVVTAIKFAHHFEGLALSRLLAEMARVARRRVIVLDIRRHWLAYWGFVLWSHVFTRNRLVRYDGPLSVLRGFTREELSRLAAPLDSFTWSIRTYPGFQIALVGRRRPN